MKRVIYFLLLIAIIFSACDKIEYDLTSGSSTISFKFIGAVNDTLILDKSQQDTTIQIQANYVWIAEVPDTIDWITVTPTMGKKGATPVTFSVATNGSEDRIGYVNFYSGDTTITFTISQSSKSSSSDIKKEPLGFATEERSLSFSYNAPNYSIAFVANANWNVEVDDDATSWLTVTPTSGEIGEHTVIVNLKNNDSKDDRIGEIAFSAGDTSIAFSITQLPAELIMAEEDKTIHLTPSEQDVDIVLYANIDNWTATVEETATSWLSIKQASGIKDNTQLTISVKSNFVRERTGKINLKGKDTTIVVTVTQEKQDEFTYDATTVDISGIDYTQQTTSFNFTANTNWTASVDEDAKSWLSVDSNNGRTGEQKLNITLEENDSSQKRIGKITIKGQDSTFVITVTQTPVFEYDEKNLSVNFSMWGGTRTFTFTSYITGWTKEDKPNGSIKYTYSPTSMGAKGTYTITISCGRATSSAVNISGYITITGAGKTFTINVKQQG